MGKANVSKILLDGEKLKKALKEKDISMGELSERIGRNNTYIYNVLTRNTMVVPATEKMICIELEVESGTFIKQESKPSQADAGVVVIEKLIKELDTLKKVQKVILETLERVLEEQEKAYNKLGGQTTSLCRVKEMLTELCKSDREKAVEFLKSALCGETKALEKDILSRSKEVGIKEADLMCAKRDLDVQVGVTGYGNNQKRWWFLPK